LVKAAALMTSWLFAATIARANDPHSLFLTSDRCVACHNGMKSASGADFSIGLDWRTSMMANSSRDPYWHASVRRETLDHASSNAKIVDECSTCHMPVIEHDAKHQKRNTELFAHLPLRTDKSSDAKAAADGISCAVCHQISPELLGTTASYNGNFVLQVGADGTHHESGPFDIDPALATVMHSSTAAFLPQRGDQIRSAQLCASCHTLITRALGANGEEIGSLPEQVPYQEWLHSDYRDERTCQSCHMPAVTEPTPIARILAAPRPGAAHHEFIAANFFMQRVLEKYHDELNVNAETSELGSAAARTVEYLQSKAARLSVSEPQVTSGRLSVKVTVQNLGGHKLPTAFPSRRAWLHLTVTDRAGHAVFESGALRENGSIVGNDNDDDASRFEPHHRVIHSPDEVQIYESILGDAGGHVTTGLLSATGYLKDNRLLPKGFDKTTAVPEIAVHGDALDDPGFTDAGDEVRYLIDLHAAPGPYSITAELWYEPVGFRWANNLKPYSAPEPRRFVEQYEATAQDAAAKMVSATVLAGK
jgi:cytochrome c551/c552